MTFQFAGLYTKGITYKSGPAAPGVAVTIKPHGSGSLATIYTDRTKATTTSNPVTTDSNGNLSFFADPGEYDFTALGGTFSDQVPADPLEYQDAAGAAPLASPAFTGTPTGPTPAPGDSTTKLSTTAFVAAAMAALVNGAPGALDTLNELAAALGNDANLATDLTNAIALKVAKANNGNDFGDAGSTRLNLHVPALTPCGAVSTSNITLSAPGSTFNGTTLSNVGTDQLLLAGQSAPSQNGPWVWNGPSAALARPTDYASGSVVKARTVQVTDTNNLWGLSTTASITVDTTATTWAIVGSGTYVQFVKMTGTPATDTANIQAAINAGGRILLGGVFGTYAVNPVLIKSGAFLDLGGLTLQLAPGANQDLISVPNFATLTGGNTTGGESRWAITNGTLDGNRANQTGTSWVFRVYALAYTIDGLIIQSGKTGNAYSEWASAGGSALTPQNYMEAHWTNFRIHDVAAGAVGLDWNGPHDSSFTMGEVVTGAAAFAAGSVGIWTRGNGSGENFTGVHVWGSFSIPMTLAKPAQLNGVYLEGGDLNQLLILNRDVRGSVRLGNANNRNDVSLQIGAVSFPVSQTNLIVEFISSSSQTNTPLSFVNSSGGNRIEGTWTSQTTTTLLGTVETAGDFVSVVCSDSPAKSHFTNATKIDVFTSNGTYTKYSGATTVKVICIGPGAGGGAGGRFASGQVPCGGGGGGGGGYSAAEFPASAVPTSVTVTVPAGGAGAAGQTSDSSVGANGSTPSGLTLFGALLQAGRGALGGGGGNGVAGTAGSAGAGQISGGAGAGSSASGLLGNNAGNVNGAAPGGGSGGGITAAPLASAGGTGAISNSTPGTAAAGGTVGAGQIGAGGTSSTVDYIGTSGAGGASNTTAAAGKGGDGGTYGAGGGGGGASLNTFTSGAGGQGGAGLCVVVTYF